MVFTKDGRFTAVDGYAEFEPAPACGLPPTAPDTRGLRGFFAPNGIVVAGVSTNPEKYSMARNIVSLLMDLGREDIYCVNPKGGEAVIDGRVFPLYKSLAEIPAAYDLLVYAAPGRHSIRFVEETPDGKAVILIAGIPTEMNYQQFAQSIAQVKKPGVRIIGPNCMFSRR